MSSPQPGGGVNLVSSTSADAIGKEVTSADFVSGQITETKNLIPSNAEISGMGMPSGKSIKLTVGTSGQTYIAPANGYFYICVLAKANGAGFNMYETNGYGFMSSNLTGNVAYKSCMPIAANHTMYFGYNNLDFTSHDYLGLWFFYAQGN